MKRSFNGIYNNLNVLVTGHTGFKGSWLSIWLKEMGAQVTGLSLDPPTNPNLFDCAQVSETLKDIRSDIRDLNSVVQVFQETQPEIVFHLAAQPIVLNSYEDPVETFHVNSQGTVNVLEAARLSDSVKAVIVITTDKCYENHEWIWGYRENDELGGHDPYSCSKAMAELAAQAYRHSYSMKIATARAGNVIGGGDFAQFRIIPDTMGALMEGEPVEVRRPDSVRPWLHVLDPLNGYLMLGQKMLEQEDAFAGAWNFGPMEHQAIPVRSIVEQAISLWGQGEWKNVGSKDLKPEKEMLRLNWDKAANKLDWQPKYDWKKGISETVDWFKVYSNQKNNSGIYSLTVQQIQRFINTRTATDEISTHPPARVLSN